MTDPHPKPHGEPRLVPSASLRPQALALLQIRCTQDKSRALQAIDASRWSVDPTEMITQPCNLPGRPDRPLLVHPSELQNRTVGSPRGQASLIHALAHIEANAINLALDIVWRFANLPQTFYRDWFRIAQEEAMHFELLAAHLATLGHAYGDFPAHDGLWDMAARTCDDVLARLALVPRTLEARGLDATPAIQHKLVSVGDRHGAQMLDIILRDEIGHVAAGNHWYARICAERGLNPLRTYAELAVRYAAPILKGPFNLPARRAAGFTEAELGALCGTQSMVS